MAKITEPTVTDNARLLLGMLTATGAMDLKTFGYVINEIDAEKNTLVIENSNGNRYSVLVVQIEGEE